MVLLTQSEVRILAGQDGWGEQTLNCIYHGAIGFLWAWKSAFQTNQHPCNLPETNGDLPQGLNLHWYIIYLDDIIIFSKDLANHLERLEAVFQKLEQARLKLKLSKCELFW